MFWSLAVLSSLLIGFMFDVLTHAAETVLNLPGFKISLQHHDSDFYLGLVQSISFHGGWNIDRIDRYREGPFLYAESY